MQKPLVILTGPTAVGKTSLSIRLAKRINAEIISADSMQVYKHMDIGTAKVTPEEMQGVRHYLIDCLNPDEEFNVTIFQQEALKAMEEIRAKGKLPMIVGGTGFYIQSVLYDIDFAREDGNKEYREELYEFARVNGYHALHERLREVDPESALEIDEQNVKRTARALEFFHETGRKISEHNAQERAKTSPYNFAYFVLNDDRARLYERINARVDLMMEQGLEAEVEALLETGIDRKTTSMQAIGYREIADALDGKCTMDEAREKIKLNTRHFAKRQLTWFRREPEVEMINLPDYLYDQQRVEDAMVTSLKKRGIII